MTLFTSLGRVFTEGKSSIRNFLAYLHGLREQVNRLAGESLNRSRDPRLHLWPRDADGGIDRRPFFYTQPGRAAAVRELKQKMKTGPPAGGARFISFIVTMVPVLTSVGSTLYSACS